MSRIEWIVFTSIITIIAFVKSVVSPIVKLNSTITNLTLSVDNIIKTISKFEEKNSENHKKIHTRIDENTKTLQNHEHRITLIEKSKV